MNEDIYHLLELIYPSGRHNIEELFALSKIKFFFTEQIFLEAMTFLYDPANDLAIFNVNDFRSLEITERGKKIYEQERSKGNRALTQNEAEYVNSFLKSGNIHTGKPYSRFAEIELRNTVFFDTKIFWEKGLIQDTGEKIPPAQKNPNNFITWSARGRKLLELGNWYAFLEWERENSPKVEYRLKPNNDISNYLNQLEENVAKLHETIDPETQKKIDYIHSISPSNIKFISPQPIINNNDYSTHIHATGTNSNINHSAKGDVNQINNPPETQIKKPFFNWGNILTIVSILVAITIAILGWTYFKK